MSKCESLQGVRSWPGASFVKKQASKKRRRAFKSALEAGKDFDSVTLPVNARQLTQGWVL